jgi:cellulose synthase operon protein C
VRTSPRLPRSHTLLGAMLLAGLCACTGPRKFAGDDAPTIKTLAGREIEVQADPGIAATESKAILAYRQFLDAAPRAEQRGEAMRRLGDLEMDAADAQAESASSASGVPDYRAAITRYRDYLKTYPDDPGNDRVIYQLSRAHEQAGELEVALKLLDQLVKDYPETGYREEANFRRGELLFSTRDYAGAERAFDSVVQRDVRNAYHERSLYMHGWSLFKLGRLEDALQSFFGVLDLKVAGRVGDGDLDTLGGLTRADRELVEDTFRVTSLSLQNLKGAESIPEYTKMPVRRGYEFRVYQQLGELYLKQDRVKDAADTFGAFVKREPLHAQAPILAARVIDIYQEAGFATLALDAKKDYVSRYGADSEFRRSNPPGWAGAQPLVKTHLAELARHYHASAQKSKDTADYQEAVRWYRAYLQAFPNEPDTAQNNFLLAELLYEDKRFADAAAEYEKTAYQYPPGERNADAGYAALLSYAAQEKTTAPAALPALQQAGIASAERFAKNFAGDSRTGLVLTNAAEKLFALRDGGRANDLALQALALVPPIPQAQRRVAFTVLAHNAFERSKFDEAERYYTEVIGTTTEKDPARAEFVERLAASVYKQGEKARADGQVRDAAGHFARVATLAPTSAVRITAQYDAAAILIGLKDWDAAGKSLEELRQRYPGHPLQDDINAKLAVVYLEKGQWAQAGAEMERLAATKKDPVQAREALFQAADLYDKAIEKGAPRAKATQAFERYVKQYPQPLAPALEARARLAKLAKADGNATREFALMKEIFQADQGGGAARTDRTRFLGANAALALAEPTLDAYRKVPLVEPLARQLKLKKAKMDDVLKAYAVATDYGVAEVTTAATFHIASLYQDFGKSLLTSQRPKKLNKTELEQYNLMLEEQADPFQEKATELHEVNARRTASGIYDKWVMNSFKALAEMRPLRYGKVERSEGAIDAIR